MTQIQAVFRGTPEQLEWTTLLHIIGYSSVSLLNDTLFVTWVCGDEDTYEQHLKNVHTCIDTEAIQALGVKVVKVS